MILSTGGRGGCLPQCMLGYHPPRAETPLGGRHPPSRHPPGADTPLGADPPSRHPPGADPPGSRHPPCSRPPRSRQPPGTDTPPPGSRRQHTVNERPVRILLECILFEDCLIKYCIYTGQFYSFTVYMVCANSVVNPFVYAIQYDEFKNRVIEILCGKLHSSEGSVSVSVTSQNTVMNSHE